MFHPRISRRSLGSVFELPSLHFPAVMLYFVAVFSLPFDEIGVTGTLMLKKKREGFPLVRLV